ncbi:MAG TPA: adenylyl-sulfate kinase, partial [Pseudomonas sp.]|nr:adenylyl-sulfate kinase [Pseudomonas sp.]
MPSNLVAPTASISRRQREARNGHRGVAILLTGLPASGKSTLAQGLQAALFEQG